MRTVCGVDLGTQSCKVILCDPEARKILASAQAPLGTTAREDGTREQDAAGVMGLPVLAPAGEESAAMGAALQAPHCAERSRGSSISIGDIVDQHIAMDKSSELFPDDQSVIQYEKAYEGYRTYLGALSPLYR